MEGGARSARVQKFHLAVSPSLTQAADRGLHAGSILDPKGCRVWTSLPSKPTHIAGGPC